MSASPLDYNSTLGPFVAGTLINTWLCGICMVQAHNYFFKCRADKPIYHYSVGVLYVINLTHTITSCYSIYDRIVLNFGNDANLIVAGWAFTVGATFTGSTAFIVQCWYAYRVYVVSERFLVLPVLIFALSLVSFAFAIACTIVGHRLQFFPLFNQFTYGVLVWLFASIASDLLITSSLVYYLHDAGKRTKFDETKSLLKMVIANVIENNGLTTAVALIDAILFVASSTAWHVTFNSFLGSLYFMSLLASLNSRRKFAEVARRRSSTAISARTVDIQPSGGKSRFVQGIRRTIGFTSEHVSSPLTSSRSVGPTTSRGSGSQTAPIGITLTREVVEKSETMLEEDEFVSSVHLQQILPPAAVARPITAMPKFPEPSEVSWSTPPDPRSEAYGSSRV